MTSLTPTTTLVGFSTPNWFNPVSWVVRKVTGSKCSHAWFLYYDQDLEMTMVMEAHELGFRLIPFERFTKYNKLVAIFRPPKPIDQGLRVVAKRYLSTTYDFGGLIGMTVVRLGQWFRVKWKNPFRGAKSVFCSEAVCIAMKESSGYEDFDEDPDSVDPQTLMDYFMARKWEPVAS